MFVQVGEVELQRLNVRLPGEAALGIRPDPARQRDLRGAKLTLEQGTAIFKAHQCRARAKHIGLAAAPAAVSGLGCADQRLGVLPQPLQDGAHLLRVVPIQPCKRRVALHVRERRLPACPFALGFPLAALAAQPALLLAGKFLHHADAAHGHEIVREAVAVRSRHRQVVHAETQDRIGKLARRDRHFSCRGHGGVLRSELARLTPGEPDGFRE